MQCLARGFATFVQEKKTTASTHVPEENVIGVRSPLDEW